MEVLRSKQRTGGFRELACAPSLHPAAGCVHTSHGVILIARHPPSLNPFSSQIQQSLSLERAVGAGDSPPKASRLECRRNSTCSSRVEGTPTPPHNSTCCGLRAPQGASRASRGAHDREPPHREPDATLRRRVPRNVVPSGTASKTKQLRKDSVWGQGRIVP